MTTMTTILMRAPRATAGAALALAALSVAGCKKNDASAEPAKVETTLVRPENVTMVRAEQIRTGPALSGSLTPERSATIRSEMSGAVLQTYAEAGQRVSAGQALAQLDASVLRDQQLSARGAVTTAQSNYDIAQRELARNQTLEKAGAIAERDLERARNALITAQGQLATARAQLANINKQLEKASVQAPFTGVVAQRQANAGDVVSPGTALFTVVDPGSMQLEASVPAGQRPTASQIRLASRTSLATSSRASPNAGTACVSSVRWLPSWSNRATTPASFGSRSSGTS